MPLGLEHWSLQCKAALSMQLAASASDRQRPTLHVYVLYIQYKYAVLITDMCLAAKRIGVGGFSVAQSQIGNTSVVTRSSPFSSGTQMCPTLQVGHMAGRARTSLCVSRARLRGRWVSFAAQIQFPSRPFSNFGPCALKGIFFRPHACEILN
jgi:hypothetical protein